MSPLTFAYIKYTYDEAHRVPNVVFKNKTTIMCVLMFTGRLMRLLTTSYNLSDQHYLRVYLLKCTTVNHLLVRKAYNLDKNRSTNA